MTWEKVKLGDLGKWYGGGTPSKSNLAFWSNGDVPWLSPKDMGPEILRSTTDRVTAAAVVGSSTKLVPAGAVAVVTRSGILEHTLPVSLVPFATTMNQDMKAVVPRDGVDPRWIAWGLRAFERDLLRDTRKAGTTVASIEMPRWYAFELPVPPLDEQRRIIAILEVNLTRLDAAEKSLQTAALRSSLLSDQLLDAALESVPHDEVPFREVLSTRLSNGRSVPTADVGFPVLRLTALRDRRIDITQRKVGAWTASEAQRFLVRKGDFLISRGNGSLHLVGRGGIVETEPDQVAYPDTLIRARPIPEVLDTTYLSLVWNSPKIRRQIERVARTTAGIYKVNQKDLGSIRVPVPALEDQRRVTASVVSGRGEVSRANVAIALARRRSSTLRRCLLTAAFSGLLVGRSSDMRALSGMIEA